MVELEEEADEYSLSKIIAAAIKGQEYDLVLGGNMAVDSGSSQVAIRVAEALDIPQCRNDYETPILKAGRQP